MTFTQENTVIMISTVAALYPLHHLTLMDSINAQNVRNFG